MPVSYQLNSLDHPDTACLTAVIEMVVRRQPCRCCPRWAAARLWRRWKCYMLRMSRLARRNCSLLAYVISDRMPHFGPDSYSCDCWCWKRCSCTPRTSSSWLWSCLFSEYSPAPIDPVSPGLGVATSIYPCVMRFQLQYSQGFCAQVIVFSKMFSTSATCVGHQRSFLPYLSIWFRRFTQASFWDFDICWNSDSPCFCSAAEQIQRLCLKLRAEHFDRLNLDHSVGSSEWTGSICWSWSDCLRLWTNYLHYAAICWCSYPAAWSWFSSGRLVFQGSQRSPAAKFLFYFFCVPVLPVRCRLAGAWYMYLIRLFWRSRASSCSDFDRSWEMISIGFQLAVLSGRYLVGVDLIWRSLNLRVVLFCQGNGCWSLVTSASIRLSLLLSLPIALELLTAFAEWPVSSRRSVFCRWFGSGWSHQPFGSVLAFVTSPLRFS